MSGRISLFLVFWWPVSSCADARVMEPPAVCAQIPTIYVRPGSIVLAVGDSVRLTARVTGVGADSCSGKELDGPFEWSSTDSAVARIDSTVVRGLKAGRAVIVARWIPDQNFTAGAEVTVTP